MRHKAIGYAVSINCKDDSSPLSTHEIGPEVDQAMATLMLEGVTPKLMFEGNAFKCLAGTRAFAITRVSQFGVICAELSDADGHSDSQLIDCNAISKAMLDWFHNGASPQGFRSVENG